MKNIGQIYKKRKIVREFYALESSYRSLVTDREKFEEDSRVDFEFIVGLREDIHKLFKQHPAWLNDFVREVEQSDQILQDHVNSELKQKQVDKMSLDEYRKSFKIKSRNHWWLWLDQLDTLTEEERSTL